MKRKLDDGESWYDVAKDESHFETAIRFHSGLSKYAAMAGRPRDFQTTICVYYGPPGTGKTRAAADRVNGKDAFWLSRPNASSGPLWWDGYNGQEFIVIDEFYGWMPRDTFQRLVDRVPLTLQVRGAAVQMRSKHICVTSNVHPRWWWKHIGLGAMQRRLEAPVGEIVYMGNEEFPTADDWELERLRYVHE